MFYNDVVNCVREHLDKWYATGNHQETAIQLVDEYEERIRADERRKFAEWLEKKDLLTLWHGDDDNETLSAEKVLTMYEKEKENV